MWKFSVNYCVIDFSRAREWLAWSQNALNTYLTPWICSNSWKREILSTSQPVAQNFSSAVHPFKNFLHPFIHSATSSVQKFSLSARPHPFRNFRYALDLIHSKIFLIRSSIRPFHCEWLGYPFHIHSLAVRSHALHSFVGTFLCEMPNLITLSLEKYIIVLEKVLTFGSKNLYESCVLYLPRTHARWVTSCRFYQKGWREYK